MSWSLWKSSQISRKLVGLWHQFRLSSLFAILYRALARCNISKRLINWVLSYGQRDFANLSQFQFQSDILYIVTTPSNAKNFIDGLLQNCSISIAFAMEILQYCAKPPIYSLLCSEQWVHLLTKQWIMTCIRSHICVGIFVVTWQRWEGMRIVVPVTAARWHAPCLMCRHWLATDHVG